MYFGDHMFRLLLLGMLLCVGLTAQAQLLIDAGYNPSYYSMNSFEQIEQKFNSSNPWLNRELKPFHWLHGIHLRLRHRFREVAPFIEINYQLNGNSYSGIRPNENSESKGKLRTNYRSVGIGIEWEKESFGLGIGIGRQRFILRHTEEGGVRKIDDDILDDDVTMVNLYVNILPSLDERNSTNLILQPFVTYPLQESDFASASSYFSIDELSTDKFWQIGLRLILSNGQR